MTTKQIAERLRVLAAAPTLSIENRGELDRMANELDPPRPEPGTVVWFRWHDVDPWQLGKVSSNGKLYGIGRSTDILFENIECKPARILAPDEVAVKVPPVASVMDENGSINTVNLKNLIAERDRLWEVLETIDDMLDDIRSAIFQQRTETVSALQEAGNVDANT